MANSGSFNTNGYDGRYLHFEWSVASQSVANNTTTINWKVTGAGGDSHVWYNCKNVSVWINGQRVYNNGGSIQLWAGTVVASGQFTIGHNNDGSKSFSASAEAGIYQVAVNCRGNGSWSLPTIARASQPSCITYPNTTNNIGAIGSTITIHMNRKSGAFTHTVRYAFGSLSGTIATGVTDNCQWKIPDSFYSQIPNAKSGTGTIYADTYNGGTKIGTKSVGFTTTVTNANPTADVGYSDTNSTVTGITGNNQLIVRNQSNLQIKISNAKAYKSASIKTASCTILGKNYSVDISGGSGTINVGKINTTSSFDLTVNIADSRNFVTAKKIHVKVEDYAAPYANITLQRYLNYYSETDLTVSASYSSLNNKNTIAITYKYKKTDETKYSDEKSLANNGTVRLTLDNNHQWNVQVTLKDKISTVTYNLTVGRGMPIIFFDRRKQSVGVNCFPAYEDSLEVGGNKVLQMDGGTVETGTLSGAGKVDSKAVTFKNTFTTAPAVTATPQTADLGNVFVGVKDITTKGFTIYYKRNGGTGGMAISWTAIAPIQ